jgi:hypothetical protein
MPDRSHGHARGLMRPTLAPQVCLVGTIAASWACVRSDNGALGTDADEQRDGGMGIEAAPATPPNAGPDASVHDRVVRSAFPGLGDSGAWSVDVRPSVLLGDLWIAVAHRGPSRPAPELQPWPDVRIALVRARADGVERVAAATVPAGLVACDVPEGAISRVYALEIDERHEGIVPDRLVLALRVTCDVAWIAAESEDQWLVLFRPDGPTLEPILNVRVKHADYDRVKNDSVGVSFDLVPATPTDAGLARVCLKATPPASGLPAASAHWLGAKSILLRLDRDHLRPLDSARIVTEWHAPRTTSVLGFRLARNSASYAVISPFCARRIRRLSIGAIEQWVGN